MLQKLLAIGLQLTVTRKEITNLSKRIKNEAAGIAAACIEDKKFPKVNSLLFEGRKELGSIAECVGVF